jgi:hypothetical protein
MNKMNNRQHGYASVTLMVFVVIGLTIAAAATTTILINSLGASKMQQGIVAYDVAESGMENAIIRFLRDPDNYTGETLVTVEGNAVVTVSVDKTTITSVGTSGNFKRAVQAQVNYGDSLSVNSWKEIY